jgi:hypothetical protein
MFRAFFLGLIIMLNLKCQTNENLAMGKMNFNDSLISFIENSECICYYSKEFIPPHLVDSLSKINGEKFEIGDSSDLRDINFSDIDLDIYKFNRMLHFICISKNNYLLLYKQGGIGTHEVLDYFNFNEPYIHKRVLIIESIETKESLIKYLKKSNSSAKNGG